MLLIKAANKAAETIPFIPVGKSVLTKYGNV